MQKKVAMQIIGQNYPIVNYATAPANMLFIHHELFFSAMLQSDQVIYSPNILWGLYSIKENMKYEIHYHYQSHSCSVR